MRPVKRWKYFALLLIIMIKDYLDIFNDTFSYFIYYDFKEWKYFLTILLIVLQIIAFNLLFTYPKKRLR